MKLLSNLVSPRCPTATESPLTRFLLVGVTVVYLGVFIFLPLATVFREAFRDGWLNYLETFRDPDVQKSVFITFATIAFVIPMNLAFGIAAAYCIGKFEFRGKGLLLTLIDLPFSVSPVISGLVWVLLFGANGWFGAWLQAHDIRIIFAFPSIVLATAFVTFPFVAREVLPVVQALGNEDEYAALTLGASGWRMFWTITLPNIKWGVLYGVILCNARAMGDFGAVSVVSGHIRGGTNTMPLQIEVLYTDYKVSSAFALSTVLALLGLMTLVLKSLIEHRRQTTNSTERHQ